MLVKVFNFVSHKVVKGWESQATYYYVWGGVRGGTLFFSAGPCFYSFTVLVLELNLSCVLCVLQRKVSCWCLLMCQSMYVKMTLTESRVASHM